MKTIFDSKRISSYLCILLVLCFIFTANACKKEDEDVSDVPPTDEPIDDPIDDPVVEVCDSTKRPVVMLHGFLASGDTYANHFKRFVINSYCEDRLFAFNWNSLDVLGGQPIEALDAFIDEVLAETGADQVDLAGHSAGSGFCYNYLADEVRATKVAHYAHLAGSPTEGPAGLNGVVPTLNIWSTDDLVVDGGEIPSATNLQLSGADHYEVATNEASFEAIYTHFNDGEAPERLDIIPSDELKIAGKVLTLGENTPLASVDVEIYEVDASTGYRLSETPTAVLTTDENGDWGDFMANENTTYEFYVFSDVPNDRPIHYYRQEFTRSDQLVYLRTLPVTNIFVTNLLGLPSDDAQAVSAIFSSSKAVISGRDDLNVGNLTLSNETFASADQSTIAFFLFDDGDGNTSGEKDEALGGFPFLNGADVFHETTTDYSITVNLNGNTLHTPNWKSDSEGISVLVFD